MLYALSSFYEYPNIDVELESFSFYDVPHTYYSIFFNNLKVGLLIALGGYFSFGLISAFILFYNGFLLCEIISITSLVGLSLNEILYGTIYHGLIEFIAFFYSDLLDLRDFIRLSSLEESKSSFYGVILHIFHSTYYFFSNIRYHRVKSINICRL